MTTIAQLFDILQKHKRMDLLNVYSDVTLKDSYVAMTPKCQSSKDDKISFQYYFYHHLDSDFPKVDVMAAIENKDFATFSRIYSDWEFKNNLIYLPDFMFIWNDTRDMAFGEVSGIWLKELFDLIDAADYECG